MKVNRLRVSCLEIYKTTNNFNRNYMKEIFGLKETKRLMREKFKLNLGIPKYNQETLGSKSLGVFVPKAYNSVPYDVSTYKVL